MGIKEIHKNNHTNQNTYRYNLLNNKTEQSLYVMDLKDPLYINFNNFYYYDGDSIRLNLTKKIKQLEIINNQNKIVTINNGAIIDVQNYYNNQIEKIKIELRPEIGEELVLTNNDTKIKHFIQMGFDNKLVRRIFEYDDKGRKISESTERYLNSGYLNYDVYEYDDNDRLIRIQHKMLDNVMCDTSIEYIEVSDQEVINEFTKFFNLVGQNRESLINELNNIDISLYDNSEIDMEYFKKWSMM